MEKKTEKKFILLFLAAAVFVAMYFFVNQDTVESDAAGDMAAYEKTEIATGSDFYSDFRQKRMAWRDREEEAIRERLESGGSEEARETASADLMTLLRRIKTEDMVEEILRGRKYEDVIFVLNETLSLVIVKKKTFADGEKDALLQFAAASAGIGSEQISIFTVE